MRRLAAVLIAAALPAAPALAQYRSDQPQVIEPPVQAAPDTSQTVGAFRNAYSAAGQPRIVLFWNVALTDRVAEDQIRTSRVQGGSTQSINVLDRSTVGEAGSARLREGDSSRNVDLTVTSGTRTTDSAKRGSPLAERDAWRLETAFLKSMSEAGVQFIDRATIMRTTAATSETPGDARTVEAKALLGKADMMLEVLMTRDPEAPLGWGFRGSLKHIDSGRALGSFYSKAVPQTAPKPAQYQATSRGFERVNTNTVTVEDIGRTLALDAMTELRGSLPPK